jgi:caffeoyl-CoA O-methyltransferase
MAAMIDEPLVYFQRWVPPRSEVFHHLEEEARAGSIPIVGPVVGKLLSILVRVSGARRVVELGTAIGYSTLFLADACRHTGGRVISFEMNDALSRRARDTIAAQGLSDVVEIRCENALEAIGAVEGPVDLVFIDIEKKDYLRVLPACAGILKPGGLLVADNTGFADARPFNQAVFDGSEWETVNLWTYLPGHSPEHDGLCLAVRV